MLPHDDSYEASAEEKEKDIPKNNSETLESETEHNSDARLPEEHCDEISRMETDCNDENLVRGGASFKVPKSALKKPGTTRTQIWKDRRVTFCESVKIYGQHSVESDTSINKLENELDCETTSLDFTDSVYQCAELFNWLELDNEPIEPLLADNHVDDAEDFLVHKVVYNSNIILDSSGQDDCVQNDIKEHTDCDSIVYYYSDDDVDCQDFVVHQVVRQENEIIPEPSDLESETETTVKNNDDIGLEDHTMSENNIVCTLSIENIQQHNKLTECKIKNDSTILKLCPSLKSNASKEVILSPPLQELSVERLIGGQSDSWFWSLDISPLNSIQETDSDSNVSSEDTMIMMTTEECQKNEQHIQESLLRFQCLKKEKGNVDNCSMEFLPERKSTLLSEILKNELPIFDAEENIIAFKEDVCHSDCSKVESCICNVPPLLSEPQINDKVIECTSNEIVSLCLETETKKDNSQDNTDYSVKCNNATCLFDDDRKMDTSFNNIKTKLDVLPNGDSLCYWDHSLSSVEIPYDVREWKITLNSLKTMNRTDSEKMLAADPDTYKSWALKCEQQSCDEDETDAVNQLSVTKCGSDELEHFVHQSTERVERIRKRYSISEHVQCTPKRGIRPQFGSTAEILKQLHNNNHLSSIANFGSTRNHLSWPCFQATEPNTQSHPVLQHSDRNSFHVHSDTSNSYSHGDFLHNQSHQLMSQMPNLHTDAGAASYSGRFNQNSNQLLISGQCPNSFCSLTFLQERGVPEGASPTKLSTESLYEQQNSDESLSDNVIYYSMKV